jgi:hypothetical protein
MCTRVLSNVVTAEHDSLKEPPTLSRELCQMHQTKTLIQAEAEHFDFDTSLLGR